MGVHQVLSLIHDFGIPNCARLHHQKAISILLTDGWYDFVERIVRGCEPLRSSAGISQDKDTEREQWYKDVAKRVKERWDTRAIDHWCGLCDKPEAIKRCK